MADTRNLAIGHPAPHRHRIGPWSAALALGMAPAAWTGQLLAGFATTSYVCFTGSSGSGGAPGWLMPAMVAIDLLALLASAMGLALGLALWRRIRHEHRDRPGGVLDAGEGRTRFLVTLGVFSSAAFAVAVLANTLSLVLVPLCRA